MKFDVVVGNPPFQSPVNYAKTGARGASKNLYQQFIEQGFMLLKNEGYISFITPPGFLKSTVWGQPNRFYENFIKYDFKYLKLQGVKKKYFSQSTPICYWIVKKSNKENNIIEIDSVEKVYIKNSDTFFIPSSLDSYTLKIFEKIANAENGVNLSFKRSQYYPNNKYVAIKAMNNRIHGIKAVPMQKNLSLGNDLILTTKYPEAVASILNSNIFTYLIRRVQYDGLIYFKFINGLKIPSNLAKQWSNESLYKFYNLNEYEIKSINSLGIIFIE